VKDIGLLLKWSNGQEDQARPGGLWQRAHASPGSRFTH
jgi:hypothetical protein